ncbi:MAG: type II CAAX prenyl endopeptidase Rce1 family protein [Candidatus Dadabacteria bacterium]
MKKVFSYLKDFVVEIDKRTLLLGSIFIAFAIFCNYHFHLNHRITQLPDAWQYICWYLIFLVAFAIGYLLSYLFGHSNIFKHKRSFALLLIAPAIFSWKMVFNFHFNFSDNLFKNEYWNDVVYWPMKIIGVLLMLLVVHRFFDKGKPFYGVTFRDFYVKPYALMLLIMVPLIAAASTQHDFLAMYPKLQNVDYVKQSNMGWYKILYELSYGSDFFTIELFFRGFLIMAFAKWVGKEAVIPMALFYCTIHFGKPLGECISSYFGGMILGAVILNNRTIFGGLMVHVGIAWLMELGGYLGHLAISP